MISPSEIIYWEILPAIRKNLVKELKNEGLKQSQIAKLLGLTPSAISLYLNNRRGEFTFEDSFKKKIKASAKKIANEEATVFNETNILIKEFEKSKEICKVCHGKNQHVKECGICYE